MWHGSVELVQGLFYFVLAVSAHEMNKESQCIESWISRAGRIKIKIENYFCCPVDSQAELTAMITDVELTPTMTTCATDITDGFPVSTLDLQEISQDYIATVGPQTKPLVHQGQYCLEDVQSLLPSGID